MMRKTLRVPWPGWLLLATLLLAGCGEGTNFGGPVHFMVQPSWVYSLVGQVANQPILLALVTNKYGMALAYASDGQHLAEWFPGPLQGTTLDLSSSDNARIQATLTAQDAQGTLTLPDGSRLAFKMNLATKPAGLYQVKDEVNRVIYLAGWVLLPDGRQAGVIQTDTQQIAAPHLNPTRPTISLPGGGKLTAQLVTPDSDF